MCEDLAATGAVDVVDFKGQYGLEVEDAEGARRHVRTRPSDVPRRDLEDPHDLPETVAPLAPQSARLLRRDDPLGRRPGDDAGEPDPHGQLKPSRTGGVRTLLDLYAHCEA